MASVTRFVEKRMRLEVNQDKSAVARPEQRHVLGFRLRPEPQEGDVEVLLSKRSRERINARTREMTPRNWGSSLDACILEVNAYLLGWLGFFGICTPIDEMARSMTMSPIFGGLFGGGDHDVTVFIHLFLP